MRLMTITTVSLAVAACGGSAEVDQFAAGNSDLSEAQIGAALGPADQSVQDAIGGSDLQDPADDNAVAASAGDDAGGASEESEEADRQQPGE